MGSPATVTQDSYVGRIGNFNNNNVITTETPLKAHYPPSPHPPPPPPPPPDYYPSQAQYSVPPAEPQMVVTIPAPQPQGEPSRGPFTIGAIGALIAGIGAVILGIIFLMIIGGTETGDPDFWKMVLTIIPLMIAVGSILVGIGFYGYYHNYGQGLGIASMVMAIISAVFWLIFISYIVGGTFVDFEEFMAVMLLSMIFSGVMLIIQGVNAYAGRHYTGYKGLATGAAVITIIAGAFMCSIIMAMIGVGFFMWAAAYFILLVLFLKADLPFLALPPQQDYPPPPPRSHY